VDNASSYRGRGAGRSPQKITIAEMRDMGVRGLHAPTINAHT